MRKRLTKIQYAMALAETATLRSEDPFYQVGAVAMDVDGRVLATGYNGLPPGLTKEDWWWASKDKRKPFVIHAEENLCSLIRRGEADLVAVTLQPCVPCFRLLVAHGVKRVVFLEEHEREHDGRASSQLAEFYPDIKMEKLEDL